MCRDGFSVDEVTSRWVWWLGSGDDGDLEERLRCCGEVGMIRDRSEWVM